MEEQLIRLLFDYAKRRKIADQEYLERLADIVVDYKGISSYFNGIELSLDGNLEFDDPSVSAFYNNHEKKIYVYELPIHRLIKYKEKNKDKFNDLEKNLYGNIIITQNALHELEHVNQRKMMISEDTLEAQILRLSSATLNNYEKKEFFKIKDDKKASKYLHKLRKVKENNYQENYEFCPMERLAEIKAYKELIDTLSNMEEYTPNILDCGKINMFKAMYSGYEDYDSPTVEYIDNNGTPEVLDEFDWYSKKKDKSIDLCKKKYSFEDRLKYGLYLDKKEKKYCKKFIKKNNKYV